MAISSPSFLSNLSPIRSNPSRVTLSQTRNSRIICSAGQTGFFSRLGRLIKEKAKSDVEKLFSGFSKTRENLAVVDELLLFWNLAETDRVLDELEEVILRFFFSGSFSSFFFRESKVSLIDVQALLVSDFGPKITIKIVEGLRDDILAGKLKSGGEIKV